MTDKNIKYLKRSLAVVVVVDIVIFILAAFLSAFAGDGTFLSLAGWGILFFDAIMLLWTGVLLMFE